MVKESKQSSKYERGGQAFAGCIVVGLGLGMLFDNIVAGAVIGTGIGFLVMAWMRGKQ